MTVQKKPKELKRRVFQLTAPKPSIENLDKRIYLAVLKQVVKDRKYLIERLKDA